ncbi:FtsH protease activity modulator HflK [Acidobacteriota bacterium]
MFKKFGVETSTIFKNLDRIVLAALGLLFLVYIASGIFVVQANETALSLRFGALKQEALAPGIHYRIPWPVDRIKKVKIKEVKKIEVGLSPETAAEGYQTLLPYCLTGDKNIIHNRFAIQYRISDPSKYLFKTGNPQQLLKAQAQAAIIEAVGQRGVDPLLTTGKRELELTLQKKIQAGLDEIGIGISVMSIETRAIQPPRLVIDAFKDVITAREEKATAIHEADNYRNKVLPEAKAEARRFTEEARAYKFQRTSAARGESQRYIGLYEQYRKARSVTRDRLFLDLIDEIMPRVKVYVLASDEKGTPVKLKLIQGILPTRPILP